MNFKTINLSCNSAYFVYKGVTITKKKKPMKSQYEKVGLFYDIRINRKEV